MGIVVEVLLLWGAMFLGGLVTIFMLEVIESCWDDRKERHQAARDRALAERQARIQSDALRVKALLDQEAFRAARALHEAARRSQGN